MKKQLLLECLEKVKKLRRGEVCELTVEGAGVLRAFVEARRKVANVSDGERQLQQKVERVLDTWGSQKDAGTPQRRPETKSQSPHTRTQLTLRTAIDKLKRGQWGEVSPDDLQLLRGTQTALTNDSAAQNKQSDRLLNLLTTVLDRYDAWLSEQEAAPLGTAEPADGSSETASVFSETEAADGEPPAKEVVVVNHLDAGKAFSDGTPGHKTMIADIDVDTYVKVFNFEGETELKGDVPGDVLINVSGGGIKVVGFISGHIVAEGDIVVEGNLQGGMLVSNDGTVTVDRILLGSTVVSKRHDVVTRHVEAPKTLFAWGRVEISGPVLGGVIYGAQVEIEGKVTSGEIHVCGRLKALAFEKGRRGAPIICLCGTLTCENYGRFLDGEMSDKRRNVDQLAAQIESLERLHRFARRMANDCYRTAVFYLLGGVEGASGAMNLQGLQTKSANIKQIIAIAEGVGKYFHVVFEDDGTRDTPQLGAFVEENLGSLTFTEDEVKVLPSEFGAVHIRYLLDRCAELRAMITRLHGDHKKERGPGFLKDTYQKNVSEWRASLGDTDREINEMISRSGIDEDVLEVMHNDPGQLPDVLDKNLEEQSASDLQSDRQRAKSPLIQLLKRSADRHRKSMVQGAENAENAERDYADLRKALAADSVVLYGDMLPGTCEVRARRYDPEVVITSNPDKRSGFDTGMAEVIVVADEISTDTTFRLNGNMIQRVV